MIEPTIEALPETHPRFQRENGLPDQQKYLEYLESLGGDEQETYKISPAISSLIDFVGFRVQEADIIFNFHCFPDDIPFNRQPWWKFAIWSSYWKGYSTGEASKAGG